MRADLHIHTTASDGRLSPCEIISQAKAANLKFIAITDHDTVSGIIELQSCFAPEITIIHGIELNTDLADYEVHILGYNIDIYNVDFVSELDKLAQDRFMRARKIIDKLEALGYKIEYDHVLKIASNSKSIGRPHIAKALIEEGYFTSMEEVFSKLLDKDSPAYVPHYKLSPKDAIRLIQSAGGVAVLAHPSLIGCDTLILTLIQDGLNGIEVYHPAHTDNNIKVFLSLANKHNLIITGGSDYHGIPGRFPEKLGEYTVPSHFAEKLLNGQA